MSLRPANRVTIFLVLVALFTAAVQVLNSRHLVGDIGSLFYMWCPALAAAIASIATRRPFRAVGWSVRPVRWILAGWAIPIACGLVAYGGVWLVGLGGVPNPRFLERATLTLGLTPGHSPAFVIAAAFAFISLYLVIPSMISAIGEEIGWRGFLVPELGADAGFRRAALVSGAVWAVWHAPAIVFGGYGIEGTPKAYQMACFGAMVVASAVIQAWLRLQSGSIWPCVVLHATHNAVIQRFFDAITAERGATAYFTGEFGIALVIPLALVAIYCLRHPPRGPSTVRSGYDRRSVSSETQISLPATR
jgi:membrane protease YdiL (CAAX protease family)